MKALTKTIAILLLAVVVVFASSCKKKNDVESEITNRIVGTWTCSNHWYGGSDTYVFKSSGKYQWTGPSSEEYGDYSFNGVILTTSSSTGVTRVFTIISLTDTYFVMMDQEAASYTYYKGGSSPGNGGGGNNNGGGTGTYNGHEYVDLGLPSGTLWATCNVGATTSEGYGDYFAWGETTTKSIYSQTNYKYCIYDVHHLTKYCTTSSFGNNGFIDNLTTLQIVDDAAAKWGNGWRMPTNDQWAELKNNTTVIWTTKNGIYGALFTASNGNVLFLPAAGYRGGQANLDVGDRGYYWSSSLVTTLPFDGYCFRFNSTSFAPSYLYERYFGLPVRPVCSAK